MFGRLAADALGTSDICSVLVPADFLTAASTSYLLGNEVTQWILRAKTDEYAFTSTAIVHLDGTSAVSTKRLVKRYPYHKYQITNVLFETAGTVDLDIELKFTLKSMEGRGGEEDDVRISIDVAKRFVDELIFLYKCLLLIAERQARGMRRMEFSGKALDVAAVTVGSKFGFGVAGGTTSSSSSTTTGVGGGGSSTPQQQLIETAQAAFDWLNFQHESNRVYDATDIYKMYTSKFMGNPTTSTTTTTS